jgi:hypothetical protein
MGMKLKRATKWLGGIIFTGFLMFAGLILYQLSIHYVMPWDYSFKLSDKVDTIEVYYIEWACDCAEWQIIGEEFLDELDKHTIFIESASIKESYTEANVKEDCWPTKLKLVGKFYEDKGISRHYEIGFEKPEPARVFYYESYEVLDSACAADITDIS